MTMDTWDMFFFTRLNVVRRHYVPVLHVEPVPARLRQLRVVVQELEQDAGSGRHPTPGAPACRDERPKSCVWAKGRLDVRPSRTKKNEGTYNYKNISSEGLILHYSFILIRKIQTATRQICNHFVKDCSHATLPTQCTCHRFHLQSLQLAMLPARAELSAIQQYSLLNCALCPQSSCHSNTEFFKLGHSSSWHDFRGASCR